MARTKGARVRCPISGTTFDPEGVEKLRDGAEVYQGISRAHNNTERYKCPLCGRSVDSYYTKARTVRNAEDGTETTIPSQRKWTSHTFIVPAVAEPVVVAEDVQQAPPFDEQQVEQG